MARAFNRGTSKVLVPAVAFATALCASPEVLAIRCGKKTEGKVALVVTVKVSASDLNNRSAAAWREVAAAVQMRYGRDVNEGLVDLRVITSTGLFGGTGANLVSAPFDFDGRTSIQKAITDYFGATPHGAADPAPCNPEQNACCDECSIESGFASASEFFRSGFFTHGQLLVARMQGGTRRWTRKFDSVELAFA